jgi:hypothetical protein
MLCVNPPQCRSKLPGHVGEIGLEGRAAADHDIIMTAPEGLGWGQPHHFPQSPPDAVALHGIADPARHRKADANRTEGFEAALPRLQHKGAGRRLLGLGGSLEVRPAFQPFHGCDFALKGRL